jgi:Zn-dependent oligopeptidase
MLSKICTLKRGWYVIKVVILILFSKRQDRYRLFKAVKQDSIERFNHCLPCLLISDKARVLQRYLSLFERNGCNLSSEKKEQLERIKKKISGTPLHLKFNILRIGNQISPKCK